MTQGGHRYRPKPRVWYRTSWFAFLAVLGVFAILVAILVVPVWATSTPDYCSSCKATRQAATRLATSPHAKVSCTACHIAPGLGNQITWRSSEWLNIWADYLNVPQVAVKGQRPSNASCLSCHSLQSIPTVINGVRFPHEVHVNMRNLTCVDCHDNVAHPAPGQSATTVSMTVCTMCHNQEGAPSNCTFCHVNGPPKDVHPKNYLKTHGQEALALGEASCLHCHHSTSFCTDCHETTPTPDHFSGDWRWAHGPAAQKDEAVCLGCHDQQTFCDKCHGVNHPADWLQTHGATAAKNGASCLVCHSQDECTQCHQKSGVKL